MDCIDPIVPILYFQPSLALTQFGCSSETNVRSFLQAIQKVLQRTSVALLVVAAISSTGYAQGGGGIGNTTSTPVAGVPHDYITGVNETVNPANGALSVRIAQPAPHERGQNWPGYAFIYESNSQYSLQPTWSTTADPPFTALTALLSSAQPPSPQAPGVTVPSVNGLSVCLQNGQYGCITWSCNVYSGYRFTDLNGGLHGLGLQLAVPVTHNSSNDCGYFSENNYYYGGDEQYKASMDTSGHVTVVDLHGNLPDVEDANGNYRNSTGRTSPLPTPFTIQTQSINPSTSLNVLNNSQDGGACQEPSIGLGGGSVLVPKSITLPNNEKYSFQYDSVFGLINKITYPTGATVTYTWSVIPDSEGVQYHTITSTLGGTCSLQHDWFAITKRVVSFDGVTNAEEQDFVYSTTWPNVQSYRWTNKQTTITTKDLIRGTSFKTVYNYLPVLPPAESDKPFEDLGYVPVENTIQYYDTTGSLLRTTTKTWVTMNTMSAECETLPNGSTSGKFYSYQAYTGFTGLSPQPINGQSFDTDLPTDVAEYDYGQVSSSCSKPGSSVLPVRETVTSYKAFANSPFSPLNSIQDRPASVQVYGVVGGVKTLLQETDYAYDGAAPSCVYSPSCATPTGHDETNYGVGSASPRGNPTTVTKKCFVGSTNCSNAVTTFVYDTTGQVLSSTDADLNTTNYSYVDNYTTDDGSPSGNTNAYPTKITRPTTNGFGHISSYKYGFEDGKLRSATDENSQITKYCYWTGGCSGSSFDPFVRLSGVSYPDSGSTTIAYNDAGPSPSETTTTAIKSGLNMVSTTTYDAIGHTVQTALSDYPSTTYTVTTYDGVGQPYQVYNPTRCSTPTTNCGESTWGYTTHNHDALNRTTSLVEQDGSIVTTTYDQTNSGSTGTCTTVKDETGKSRQSCSDVLGRMTGVWEDPAGLNYETDYTFDGLGNMLSVTQKGSNSSYARVRNFTYDSLSRLLTANNPESGTITYSYDANSNLVSKVAPKPGQTGTATVTTNYAYDALNRLTQKSYVGMSTSGSQYGYDGTRLTGCGQNPPIINSPTNLIGRRSAMCSGASGSSWSYDSMGRPVLDARVDNAGQQINYSVGYTYNLDGSINTLTYPSGDVLTYTPGQAGRPLGVSDSNNTYVANGTYAPNGSLVGMTNGQTSSFAGIVTSNIYNNRLQPFLLKASTASGAVFDLCYDFHLGVAISAPPPDCNLGAYSTGDNGSVFQIANEADSTRSSAYIYDSMNRVAQAYTLNATSLNCWGETYASTATAQGVLPSPSTLGIDAWGNLTNRSGVTGMGGCKTEGLSASASTKNQLSILTYDAAGNVTNDGLGNQPTYDAENRIVTNEGYTYSYDADGVRMEKASGSSGTKYWFGPSGQALTETTLAGTINAEYVFFNGERIARIDQPSGTVHYYFSNHLGSASVITTALGVVQEQMDFYPFGGVAYIWGSDPNHYEFTGKERDSESGLDNFGARYFTSSMGRFMTPDWAARPTDVPYAAFGDPQSLNLYTYVRNDPVSRADADGHCFWCHLGGTDEPPSWSQRWTTWFWGGGDFSSPPDLSAQKQKAGHHRRKSPYQPKNKPANVIFNETGTIQGNAQAIHEMRVDTGHVYMNVKHKSAFQGQNELSDSNQDAIAKGINVGAYKDSLSAAAEAQSDPSDPTNGAIHFFVLDTTPGRNEDVPSWAQGREAKLGPFTAGANDSNADIHKGDTIFVLIDPGP